METPKDRERELPAAEGEPGEWATLAVAPNVVLAEMAEALLLDAGFEVTIVSDDFVGIGGHAARPRVLCRAGDLEEALRLLRERGMV